MPTYEYICKVCGHEFEQFQSMKDDPLTTCPECRKNSLKRKIGTGAGIIFKGSGFYCTDYRSGGGASSGKDGDSANVVASPTPMHESPKKEKQKTA